MAKRKEETHVNPYFREHESLYDGGEMKVASPVGSIWDQGYLHEGLNVMDKVIGEQAPQKSKRSTSGKGAK
jgi:hypothetical protein